MQGDGGWKTQKAAHLLKRCGPKSKRGAPLSKGEARKRLGAGTFGRGEHTQREGEDTFSRGVGTVRKGGRNFCPGAAQNREGERPLCVGDDVRSLSKNQKRGGRNGAEVCDSLPRLLRKRLRLSAEGGRRNAEGGRRVMSPWSSHWRASFDIRNATCCRQGFCGDYCDIGAFAANVVRDLRLPRPLVRPYPLAPPCRNCPLSSSTT